MLEVGSISAPDIAYVIPKYVYLFVFAQALFAKQSGTLAMKQHCLVCQTKWHTGYEAALLGLPNKVAHWL